MQNTRKVIGIVCCLYLALALACTVYITADYSKLTICYTSDGFIQLVEKGEAVVQVAGKNMTAKQLGKFKTELKKHKGAYSIKKWAEILSKALNMTLKVIEKLPNRQDSVFIEVNIIRDTLAEAELEQLFPIPGNHWFAFKIDPADTSSIIFPDYDSADVEMTFTFEVALIDSAIDSLPDSIAIITSNYPDFDPETGEVMTEWSEPTYRGSMPIKSLGPCGQIPTLTEWGMIIFCILLFGWMAWVIVRRRRRVTTGI